MRIRHLLLLIAIAITLSCQRDEMPHTPRTDALVRELLSKLDSTDVYAARKEAKIDAVKAQLPGNDGQQRFALYYTIAEDYHNYIVDSSLVYLEKAVLLADQMGMDSLRFKAMITKATVLADTGFYTESQQTIQSVPRDALEKWNLYEKYYNAFALLYHNLYSDFNVPDSFEKEYRQLYNVYRDSLMAVSDTASITYMRNAERKAARAGDYALAREYNARRRPIIENEGTAAYATWLYDRFAIAYLYEHKLTGEAVDDLLECAIIEVEDSNQDIASLLRVESFLINTNKSKAAKKVSDYYFSSLRRFGSRKRLLDGMGKTLEINDRDYQVIHRRNKELQSTLVLISLLLVTLIFALVNINRSRLKISSLKDHLEQSDKISKNYVGVLFQLYSSYIKRLNVFRTKIHSNLRKGHVEQALELTSPLGDSAAEERRELFHNFDTAFVDIFPDYIQAVNACMKPESQIIPKKTEILNTELRILALIKLGIEDSNKIAEMLQCSVKTVYNLRSGLKARLRVPEEEFNKVISEL